jgi:hypothetical protein
MVRINLRKKLMYRYRKVSYETRKEAMEAAHEVCRKKNRHISEEKVKIKKVIHQRGFPPRLIEFETD